MIANEHILHTIKVEEMYPTNLGILQRCFHSNHLNKCHNDLHQYFVHNLYRFQSMNYTHQSYRCSHTV